MFELSLSRTDAHIGKHRNAYMSVYACVGLHVDVRLYVYVCKHAIKHAGRDDNIDTRLFVRACMHT